MPIETLPLTLPIIEEIEDLEIDDGSGTGSAYRVILYDDDYHDIEDVVNQIMKATQCSFERAAEITLEAHNKGRAICYYGERAKCRRVADVLREIRLQCEVDCD